MSTTLSYSLTQNNNGVHLSGTTDTSLLQITYPLTLTISLNIVETTFDQYSIQFTYGQTYQEVEENFANGTDVAQLDDTCDGIGTSSILGNLLMVSISNILTNQVTCSGKSGCMVVLVTPGTEFESSGYIGFRVGYTPDGGETEWSNDPKWEIVSDQESE